jgi:hypothetical protein
MNQVEAPIAIPTINPGPGLPGLPHPFAAPKLDVADVYGIN